MGVNNFVFEPVIKWSGSKRSQAFDILGYFPYEIDTYYEPFCGGCSVLNRLMHSDIQVKHFVCSDLNNDLISLWNLIKDNPREISLYYSKLWNEINSIEDIEGKKHYFSEVRERFNREKNPLDFMFIMRTTTNGMPRYNSGGEFNNSYHVTRPGIAPETLEQIINSWSFFLNRKNVQFICCSYDEIVTDRGDFLYLDPPYSNTKGMYFGKIDLSKLWEYLRNCKCNYVLSFDGISGDVDNTANVPSDIYDKHIYLKSGNSSFKRVIGKSNNSTVYESLYIKRNTEFFRGF